MDTRDLNKRLAYTCLLPCLLVTTFPTHHFTICSVSSGKSGCSTASSGLGRARCRPPCRATSAWYASSSLHACHQSTAGLRCAASTRNWQSGRRSSCKQVASLHRREAQQVACPSALACRSTLWGA